jgi:hypothetical protein
MGRLDRLREYSRPPKVQGQGRDMAAVEKWQRYASENSYHGGDRASDGPMRLPSTGKVAMRETEKRSKIAHRIDRLMAGTEPSDKNMVGDSSYMRGVRREA